MYTKKHHAVQHVKKPDSLEKVFDNFLPSNIFCLNTSIKIRFKNKICPKSKARILHTQGHIVLKLCYY